MTFTDGTKKVIQTDESWKTSYGPILSSDIYNGETYDSRLERTGWNNTGYSEDSSWQPVKVLSDGKSQLVSMTGPPVTKHETLKVVKLIKTPKGEKVIDFGQNSGWLGRLESKRQGGRQRSLLSHAEVLDKCREFLYRKPARAKAQDTYIIKGGEEEIYEPHFTFQGFQVRHV